MRRYLQNKSVLKGCKIYQMLLSASKRPHLSLHTPGHKVGKFDLTELSFSDNLSAPKSCILGAEKDIAAILRAKQSFILTDGSTSGVFSMLYAAKNTGATKVAFLENSHKSVYNGCELLGLIPILLTQKENTDKKLVEKADAILLTCPTYYGKIFDLERVKKYCQQTGKLLLIDGAHGGHLHFQKEHYAGSYADIWVDGVHKSLPAFTQGAIVSTNREDLIDALRDGVNIFRTSSPSYPIMASVEYAVKYPRNEALEEKTNAFKEKFPDRLMKNEDWTKLCAYFGESAFEVEKILENKGIYAEFCDGERIMFYLSPALKEKEFEKLCKTLEWLFLLYPANQKDGDRVALKGDEKQKKPAVYELNKKENEPTVYENTKMVWVPLEEAIGRICAQNCGLFPPCTPLIKAGEKVRKEQIELLKKSNNVFGVIENRILVYKNEKR